MRFIAAFDANTLEDLKKALLTVTAILSIVVEVLRFIQRRVESGVE